MGGHDGDKVQTREFCSNTMLNHYLSQNVKLIRNDEFNYLINTLTHSIKCGARNMHNIFN
jgi:hypothetical protein